jgi:3'(2'), 5'-bisphosphate nucleotidase
VVLAPATGLAFYGGPDGAVAGRIADGRMVDRRPIRVTSDGPVRIVASRSHGHAALAELCRTMKVEEDVSVGSSLKFCLLAQGEAQLYPRFTPTMEWDTAAGQAVLEAAGGAVLSIDGGPLRYGNPDRNFLNPFFAAAASRSLAEATAAEMRRLLA